MIKPLGQKSYGTIPHLPGSRQGRCDKGVNEGQSRICQVKARDAHDCIIVQEKLDGSNVAVAKVEGKCIPINRAGYIATTSTYLQHRLFADWVGQNYDRFDAVLEEGERLCGEWLIQAHGTRYDLPHAPFVAFDVMIGTKRMPYDSFLKKVIVGRFMWPRLLHMGGPITVDEMKRSLYSSAGMAIHDSIDRPEGAVWRVERRDKQGNITVDFLAKWVDPCKVDGCYFPEVTGGKTVWNTWPGHKEMWPERFDT